MPETLPASMTCVEIAGPSKGPEALRVTQRSVPTPAPGEVLIKVAAAGVNRPDLLQRQGVYPPPSGASDLPGLEVAGAIAALGEGVMGFEIGDAVCALLPGGGYAEYCVAAAPLVLPNPAGFSMVEAAAIPETFFTVWTNVFERGRLQPQESFLVHGGTSGIGTAAIQLASHFQAEVYATAGSDDKAAACERLGAKMAINYRKQDFVQSLADATGGKGINLILDMVGGDYFTRNLKALALEGRLVQIAYLRGANVPLDLQILMQNRLSVMGSTLRSRSVAQKAEIARQLHEKVWPLLNNGKIKPVIQQTFALQEAAKAHAALEEGDHVGKIMLTI